MMKSMTVLGFLLLCAALMAIGGSWESKHKRRKTGSAMMVHIEASWACTACGQEFRTPDTELPPVACPYCGARNSDVTPDYSKGASRTYTCHACGNAVGMPDGGAPVACPYCGKAFQE